MKKKILFVDDEKRVLDSLRRMLRSQRDIWEITCVNHPKAAWEKLLRLEFDAMVSDISMPGTSGLQLLERVKQTKRLKHLPVVMLTGLEDRKLKRQALDLGAADLLNKPVDSEDLVARLRSVLRLKSYQDELKAYNDLLEQKVEERTEQLCHSRLDVIWRLAKAAEHRDTETANHVIRVGCMSRLLAEALGMNNHFTETLFLAAPLHDIGKIGIPDAILLKRGALGPGQWTTMTQHCAIGERILREDSTVRAAFLEWRGTSSRCEIGGFHSPFLETAATVALTHHEKWDGTGYPQGLSGEEIPLESCIVAISDVFDAVTSKRPYKEPYSEDQALQIIRDGAGAHFAPDVYTAFMEALPEIRSIRKRFADGTNILPEMEETEHEADLVCR